MSAAIFIYYTPDWGPLADIVLPRVREYCAKHGFWLELICEESEQVGLSKMKELYYLLPFFDFIWVLDLDTLVTNQDIQFTQFVDMLHDIFICNDVHGINAGSWIIRNTILSKIFVQQVIYNYDAPEEQTVMKRYLDLVKVRYLHHPSINSYMYTAYVDDWSNLVGSVEMPTHAQGNWQAGDLLLHLPGLSMDKRLIIFENIINESNATNLLV